MAENRLLDTNILVYAYDVSEKRRREVAKSLVRGEKGDILVFRMRLRAMKRRNEIHCRRVTPARQILFWGCAENQ